MITSNINIQDELFDKFILGIKNRMLKHNKNWLAIICGETGSGKSYTALTLANLIGKNVYTVFTPIEFLELLNSKKLKKGDVVVFDEAGVGMSSREWYSIQNKLLGSVLQTFRNLNVSVIFTTPNLSFIDVQARKLFHAYFETVKIDYQQKQAYLKAYQIQVNSRIDKIYYKRPKIITNNGTSYTLGNIVVDKAPDKIINEYEIIKAKYTEELNKNALAEIMKPKETKKEEVDLDKIKEIVNQNKDKYTKTYNKRSFIDADLVRNDFNLTIAQSGLIKKYVEANTQT